MKISLTPELERMIHNCIKSGHYHSAGEVVCEGLRLLEERAELHRLRLAEMRDRIAAGLTSLDHGDGVAGEAAFDELESGLDIPSDRRR